jgi:multiple sugar transport system ATP-binding protein
MPDIKLENLTKRWGSVVAVDNLNLTIPDRSFTCLLGPSGCGKTTTLRMIAGLEEPTRGRIISGDKPVFCSERGLSLSPDKRDVGLIFQNYALWPHMTVFENIAFGLEMKKMSRSQVEERVKEAAGWMQIDEYLQRYPSELSGGQQQRVALARSLAPRPNCLLMDEPLSNLDAKLRMDMRTELKRIHAETDMTVVYVTHDQLEAISMATTVVVMKEGRLEQCDEPLRLYKYPNNLFVADFVGSPSINLVNGKIVEQDNIWKVQCGDWLLSLKKVPYGDITVKDGQEVIIGVRCEDVLITGTEPPTIGMMVYSNLPTGSDTFVRLRHKDILLTAKLSEPDIIPIGSEINVSLRPERVLLFDGESGKRVSEGSSLVGFSIKA